MSAAEIALYILLCFSVAAALLLAVALLFFAFTDWYVERRPGLAIGMLVGSLLFGFITCWLAFWVVPTFYERIA